MGLLSPYTYNNLVERRIETRRSRGTAITDPKPVIGISLTDGSVIKYESAIDALKDGFHNVGMCIRGQRRSAGGYKWYYAT